MAHFSIIKQTVRGRTRWGYAVHGLEKRRRVFTNPDTKKPFTTRAAAAAYIRLLEARETGTTYHKVRDIAEWLFEPGSPWLERHERRRDGRPLADSTLRERRQHVRDYILPTWGETDPGEIKAQHIEDWLYSLEVSNRYRGNILQTMATILEEFHRRDILHGVPKVETPRGTSRKRSVLTLDQLRKLFPTNRDELQAVWADPRESKKLEKLAAYRDEWRKIAACAGLMFFGGMRPQEARAVCIDQLRLDDHAVLITRSVNTANELVEYVKMGDERDPRYRGAILPDFAVALIRDYMDAAHPTWLLFPRPAGGPITRDHLAKRCELAYKQSGIDVDAGRYSPYSGRYTWRTLFGAALDPVTSMALMGHRDKDVHQAYNVPVLEDQMRGLSPVADVLNGVWGG